MTVGKRSLALLAVLSLAVPAIAAPAFAFGGAEPTEVAGTTFAEGTQSLVVAEHVATTTLARASYAVEVIAPPPPPPVVVTAPERESEASAPEAVQNTSFVPPQGYSGDNVIAYAEQFVGVVQYGTGNHPDDSFSCDGYVQYVFAGFGIDLPRTANAQAALGTAIPQSEARAGDLLWWPDTHIAIYDGHGGMLDSPYWGKPVRHRADLWNNPVFIRLNV